MVKWRIERGVVQQTESLVRGFYEVKTVSGSGDLQADICESIVCLLVLYLCETVPFIFCCKYYCTLNLKTPIYFFYVSRT